MAPWEGLLLGSRGIRGIQLFCFFNFLILHSIYMASLTSFVSKPLETVLGILRNKVKEKQCIIDNHRTYLT